jgi:hypothetical protein
MKTARLFIIILTLYFFQMCTTRPQTNAMGACFKGKLVKSGICGQKVIKLLSERAEGIVITEKWTDSLSNKEYENVFTVGNACDFPVSIKEGDEFSFRLTVIPPSDCIQCYAYTPVPAQKNYIKTGCVR